MGSPSQPWPVYMIPFKMSTTLNPFLSRLPSVVGRRKLKTLGIKSVLFLLCVSTFVFILTKHQRQKDSGDSPSSVFSHHSSSSFSKSSHERIYHHTVIPIKELSGQQLAKFNSYNPVVKGWGELGAPVNLITKEEKEAADKLFSSGAFNVYISDRLPFNRTLLDPRPKDCANINYDINDLGTTSVVIIFTDEIWSALMRTIWSVWNRTPDVLLKEIILVDDWSTKNYLKQDLDDYCGHYFGDRVKIIRTKRREGLIRARVLGAEEAKGDVIVFLDSHCEVTTGWLEPMMDLIKKDKKNVVCPVIDVIDDKTLTYSGGYSDSFQIGGFTWSGHFTWIDIPPDEQSSRSTADPVESPTMAGGLFAIHRGYFFEIGSYDTQMEIWGGENLELSFRVWQCGGNLLIHPCSHVGHIFRDYHPYSFNGKDSHGLNTLRTIRVWMDPEYHKYFFMYRPELESKDAGDLSERMKLKETLQCKSFSWYLDKVYKNRKTIFDRNVQAYGFVRNPVTNLCFDTMNENEEKPFNLKLYHCSPRKKYSWTNQVFSLSLTGEIFRDDVCLQHPPNADKVGVHSCETVPEDSPEYKWKTKELWTHKKGGPIVNVLSGKCISAKGAKSEDYVRMVDCDENDFHQIWWFQSYTDVNVHRKLARKFI